MSKSSSEQGRGSHFATLGSTVSVPAAAAETVKHLERSRGEMANLRDHLVLLEADAGATDDPATLRALALGVISRARAITFSVDEALGGMTEIVVANAELARAIEQAGRGDYPSTGARTE
jgi:hypothetical protein